MLPLGPHETSTHHSPRRTLGEQAAPCRASTAPGSATRAAGSPSLTLWNCPSVIRPQFPVSPSCREHISNLSGGLPGSPCKLRIRKKKILSAQMVRNPPATQETWVRSWVGKIPWRRKWLPTPVFLPGESHGQRRLAGKSPWGHKEADTTEQLTHSLSGQGKCLCIHVHLTDGQWMDENRINDIYLTGITPLL